MSLRDPFTASPAQAERNRRVGLLSAYVDGQAVNEPHALRARVRIAALHPPCRPFPSVEDVDAAIAATAPAPTEETDRP